MNSRTIITIATLALLIGGGFWLTRDKSGQPEQPQPGTETQSAADAFEGLDEVRETFIWDAEHFTFELETHIGKPIAAAIVQRDAAAIQKFFREGFQAQVLQKDTREVLQVGVATSQRNQSTNEQPVSPAEFAQWLITRITDSSTPEKARVRVLKISKPDPDSDEWNLHCLLTINATSADGVPQFLEQHADVSCRFTTDEDVQAGTILTSWKVLDEDIRTCPPLMKETTSAVALDKLPLHDNWVNKDAHQYGKQIAVADFDGNGFPDIALATLDRQVMLLANNGSTFENVTASVGLPETLENFVASMLVTWIDFDNDGDPDLLVDDKLFANEGGQFAPVKDCNLKLNFNPMGSAVADFDADGLVDIYVLYQHRQGADTNSKKSAGWVGDDHDGAPNQLWKNLGGGKFKDVTGRAKVSGSWRHSFAAAWLHANDDHYPDLYVANDFAQNSFFLNNGNGTFTDISESSGTADFATSMGVAAGDINNDGRPEVYVANMYSKMGRRILAQVCDDDYPEGVYDQLLGACAGNRMYQVGDDANSYHETSEDLGINGVGWAYAPAFCDFNADGFSDIYATAGFLSFQRDKPDG